MAFVSARLTELELKYMRLERTVEELSGVVAEQQKTIDRLLAQLAATAARVRDLGDAAGPGDENPPHY
ncbi:MAG TPA: SlyX family protein [Polyangiaceae bacterium]|nr:SlyX family protein [Polyangiaceae bacterium]